MNNAATHIDIVAPSELTSGQIPTLAILPTESDEYSNAQPHLDPEAVERFCQVWAEVGRAILTRRSKQ